MQTLQANLTIIGADGAGLRAVTAAAQANPNVKIALISKMHSMCSHTATTGGDSATVAQDHDSLGYRLHNTVAGEDQLCEQGVMDCFVHHCSTEMTQLEQWGCSRSRREDGSVDVCRLDGMRIKRTWLAADKTGFHMLHTLFQAPSQLPQIQCSDEHFILDALVDDGYARGLVIVNMMENTLVQIRVNVAVMITSGVSHVYRYDTSSDIATSNGMGIVLSRGAPLCNMEFVQYHPTGLSGPGTLMTEGCCDEGDILVNKNGYRYLQDYGMGPGTPLGESRNKYMELGPCGEVPQAFWYEWYKGSTTPTPRGDVIHLDLRRLGEKKLFERLPFICGLTKVYMGVDLVREPILVHLTAYYTMGSIETDQHCEVRTKGLFTVGECSPASLHGANHLGSNSLTELVVFGRVVSEQAVERAVTAGAADSVALDAQVAGVERRLKDLVSQEDNENWSKIRDEMGLPMEEDYGTYHTPEPMQKTVDKPMELQERLKRVHITDTSSVSNTGLLYTVGLGHGLNAAECAAHSVLACKESRGAHQRLDEGCIERDDVNFLKHTLTFRDADDTTRLEYSDMRIIVLPPAERVYGGEAEAVDKKKKANGRDEKPES